MINWVASLVPWWAWLIAAAVAIGAVWRLMGWQGALIAGAGLLAALGYGKGRVEGAADERSKQRARIDNLQEKYDEIDRQAVDPAGSYDRLRGLSDDRD